tara:strand:+ start:678 stop:899 length:222 start_codon:yes stop_codon:yes gene_type:complete
MGFKSGKTVYKQLPKESVDPLRGLPSFSEEDFIYLFSKLQDTDFKGHEIEKFSILTLKLQEMFVFLKSNELLK